MIHINYINIRYFTIQSLFLASSISFIIFWPFLRSSPLNGKIYSPYISRSFLFLSNLALIYGIFLLMKLWASSCWKWYLDFISYTLAGSKLFFTYIFLCLWDEEDGAGGSTFFFSFFLPYLFLRKASSTRSQNGFLYMILWYLLTFLISLSLLLAIG